MSGVEMKQAEYQNLLYNTYIWSNLSPKEQEESLAKLMEFVIQKTPKELFRFRYCSDRSFDAFYKDQIWTSSADVMNDDFDARMFSRLEALENWIKSQNGTQVINELLTVQERTGEIPSHLKELFPNIESLLKLVRTFSNGSLEDMEQLLKAVFFDSCGRYRDDLIQAIQQTTKFACFSTNICSPLMWGHYADSAAGFALAYDFKDKPYYDDDGRFSQQYSCELYPVLYTNQRFDATDYALNLWIHIVIRLGLQLNGITFDSKLLSKILPPVDSFGCKKIALHKAKDWAPEREWRLFINPKSSGIANSNHIPIPKRPSALYLGRKISEINEKILTEIALEKKIPIYKMEVVNDKKDYKLKPKRINGQVNT